MESSQNRLVTRQSRVRSWLLRAVVGIALAVAGIVVLNGSSSVGAMVPEGGPTSQVTAGGLVLSLRVAPGPYFLSELLATEMVLANHSQTTYDVGGTPAAVANNCNQTMSLEVTGGGAPHFTPGVRGIGYCPFLKSTLKPGQTWTIVQMLPIMASGTITLTAQSGFLQIEKHADGSSYMTEGDGPFAGRWPAIHLSVASTIPAGRRLALHALGSDRVVVTGPLGAITHLYTVYDVTCHSGQSYTEAPDFAWGPVTGNVLVRAECPGNDVVWKYSIGAPGYAIASGAYPVIG